MVEKRSLQKNDDNSTQLKSPAGQSCDQATYSRQLIRFTRLQKTRLQLDHYSRNVTDILHNCLRFEFEAGLAFNTAPLFLAVGIIVYFSRRLSLI